MALKIQSENKGGGGKRIKPGERLWLTKDKSALVPDGHPDAKILYCNAHSSVPEDEYKALGKLKTRAEPKKRTKAQSKPKGKK